MQSAAPEPTTGWARLWEIARYGVVGASSSAIFLGAYAALVTLHVPYLAAQLAAFLLSVAWGYVLHHHYTFRSGPREFQEHGGRVGRWLAVQGSALVLNTLGLALLVGGAGLGEIVAQVVLFPLIPLYTYALSRRHVFT